ncbi:electron transfer flavoprotein subunit alpha/FixB family protein [Dissulfurirhabdus thermomarina]|uniref:Electron transfer flavoprotein subunit alpha/FixB family protein n=1 Tax=Dissulfurirhabdus thermomarina TaxID=1765737 RepID=A0A6N9TLS8_DISTH|nr:electron transfer flavoprotein subunit alpha/FixB family protein [Dissulfurirhabdus thermomarina]NDY42185.1 electron transfer flavoprotein subunit alpha/FixB family protein [Dissulfurirhabdus thermomarina]NMX22525.1 electron transfer flavoprotein subunit alpha/FixB family protein [Dissulfurirhabdus thermomarina]
MEQWQGIWVVGETAPGGVAPVTLELMSKGRLLADKLGTDLSVVLIGHGVGALAEGLGAHGADRVYVADHPELADFADEPYARILADLAARERPEVILAGATATGRGFIPRVATLLETGLTADCVDLDVDPADRILRQTRPAWGGNLMATIVCPDRRPQMATVRPNVFRAAKPEPGRRAEVVPVAVDEAQLRRGIEVLEHVETEASGGLREAEIVVTAGRGVGPGEGLELLRRLCELVGGELAATRAVTDAGWLPHRCMIGQTGETVAPRLYMGFGVSGAMPHVVGMQGAEIVVAVNKDPKAPIFDLATYGIVGDVHEILPVLVERLRGRKDSA